jgi:hypothetical protein
VSERPPDEVGPIPPAEAAGEPTVPRVDRRRLLLGGGLGGALLLGGAALGRGSAYAGSGTAADTGDDYRPGAGGDDHAQAVGHGPMEAQDELERLGLVRGGYGHGPQPPRDLDPALFDELTYPPAPDGARPGTVRDITIPVTEERWPVADGATVDAWTYGGRVPGPVIRAG